MRAVVSRLIILLHIEQNFNFDISHPQSFVVSRYHMYALFSDTFFFLFILFLFGSITHCAPHKPVLRCTTVCPNKNTFQFSKT